MDSTNEQMIETIGYMLSGQTPEHAESVEGLQEVLPKSVIDVLDSHTQELSFEVGEFLIQQGERGDSLMILCSGQVEISIDDLEGQRHVIDHAGPGEVLGEMSLLGDEPRSANARAVAPIRCKVLSAEAFHALARKHPEMSVLLSNLIARRLGHTTRDALTDKVLGDYRISRRLGKGGMGVVYEAIGVDQNRPVALKMMSHRLVYSDHALRQFQQEADIIESFRHANIVNTYGRFEAFHTYFLVMELCDGQTLQEMLSEGKQFSEQEFRTIFGQLASAVEYAHGRGVVHRDIKPGNTMICANGQVKLMDFGLAEPILSSANTGKVSGTPRYMAPEQRTNSVVTKEADYFSLGCVAFEMLTGKPLFTAGILRELMRRFDDWKHPSTRSLRPDLSDEVHDLVELALSVDPAKRAALNISQTALWA